MLKDPVAKMGRRDQQAQMEIGDQQAIAVPLVTWDYPATRGQMVPLETLDPRVPRAALVTRGHLVPEGRLEAEGPPVTVELLDS